MATVLVLLVLSTAYVVGSTNSPFLYLTSEEDVDHGKEKAFVLAQTVPGADGLQPVFIALFVLDMAAPDRAYSEMENTTLTQRPKLTAVSVDGLNSYFTNYTKYVKDQVFGRDQWIDLQSLAETTLFQKTQSGGILLGKEHRMFARRYRVLPSEEKTWNKNLAAVSSLSERCPGKVSFMLVPSASTVYPEKLPLAAPQMDEEARINEAANVVQGGHFINVLPALYDHKDEYLYYRTDHHWTTLGAYYAYEAFCKELGLTPFDRSTHTVETAEDFYGTHYSKARTWNAEPDTITWYDLQNKLTIWNVTGPGQPTDGTETGLYDTAKLDVYDKYAMFLHGNNGLSRVEGDGTGKILVIKDSYANSFVPYLTANYGAIDVVDFRNYNYGLDQLIADNDYDAILVLYSYSSFTSDPYLYRAGVAG